MIIIIIIIIKKNMKSYIIQTYVILNELVQQVRNTFNSACCDSIVRINY